MQIYDKYRIVVVRALVHESDVSEVQSGFLNTIENDSSLGGYLNVKHLSEEDQRVWADVIRNNEE